MSGDRGAIPIPLGNDATPDEVLSLLDGLGFADLTEREHDEVAPRAPVHMGNLTGTLEAS